MVCSYPDGLQGINEFGEELFCIVVKNLYGGPQSGRNWGRCRDYTLLSVFNDADTRALLQHRIIMDKVKIGDKAEAIITSGVTDGWKLMEVQANRC